MLILLFLRQSTGFLALQEVLQEGSLKRPEHQIVRFPSARYTTIDIGRIALRKHHVAGLLEVDITELRARLREARFRQLQLRRGQTEARIAIFKNGFLGAPLLAKGHENQARQVAWAVLTHDLWLLAGLPKCEKRVFRKAS